MLAEHPLPPRLVAVLERLHSHFKHLDAQIGEIDRELVRQLAEDEVGQRLLTISQASARLPPACSPPKWAMASNSAVAGTVAASIGLVPRQYGTGGKANLLGISKRGDKNIRRLLVQCARAYMMRLDRQTGRLAEWVRGLLIRRHSNVVACALAMKLARTSLGLAKSLHTTFNSWTGQATRLTGRFCRSAVPLFHPSYFGTLKIWMT